MSLYEGLETVFGMT